MGRQAKSKQARKVNDMAVIERFCYFAAPILKEYFRPDSCLNATRVIIGVLDYFGVACREMSVLALVFNEVWWKRMEEKNAFPESAEESDTWVADGGWSLYCGPDNEETSTGWPGHLVVLAAGHLIDPFARQFCRNDHKILAPDILVVPVSRDFATGAKHVHFKPPEAPAGFNSVIAYRALPHDKRYEEMPGWTNQRENPAVALEIVSAMEERSSDDE
ncbi:MAG: hypothetical protein A2Y38_17150 [Spirochaetes bacterium GWB1_59_5]|nr:MAG: hypothetical protein A2Y38_17150 [Spirochaetes bacterium GWB1_59_5]